MKGYKGFEKGLVCRGKQYSENTVFEEQDAVICKKGMHFCENPFYVLDYYNLLNDEAEFNDFAEVEALDEAKTDDHRKYCAKKLRVGANLSFAGFVEACVNFAVEKTKVGISSGNGAQIGSSGDWAQIGSSGNGAKIGSSGDSAQIGSSGNSAQIGSSGDGAQIGSSGNGAQIGSSGDFAQIGSSGDGAQIGSSGDGAKIGSSGKNSVICCAGNGCKAKAKTGSWITFAEWKEINGEYTPVCVKTERVDGVRIKEDTYYKLENGEFVEA